MQRRGSPPVAVVTAHNLSVLFVSLTRSNLKIAYDRQNRYDRHPPSSPLHKTPCPPTKSEICPGGNPRRL